MKKEFKMTLRGNTPVEKVPKFFKEAMDELDILYWDNDVNQVKIKIILEAKKT